MTGVFVSYTRSDEALARRVRLGLKSLGVEVLWDESMLAVDWRRFLNEKIRELTAVVVLWTKQSIESESVDDEARLGLENNKIVNVLIGLPKPPWPYDRKNGFPLDGWTGTKAHVGWTRLVATIDDRLGQAGLILAGSIITALAQQEAEIRERRAAISKTERALTRAQGDLSKLEEQAILTKVALDSAEAQIAGLQQIKASRIVMAAANAEREEAQAALAFAKQQASEAASKLKKDKAAIERLKVELDIWLVSIGAELNPAPDGEVGLSMGVMAKSAPPEPEPPKEASPEEFEQKKRASEALAKAAQQAERERAETERKQRVADVARLAQEEQESQERMASRRALVKKYWPVAAILGAILLVFMFLPKSSDISQRKVETETPAPDAKASEAVIETPTIALTAPSWILGDWGVGDDCTNPYIIDGSNGGIIVKVGQNGDPYTENLRVVRDDEVVTESAQYVLKIRSNLQGRKKIIMTLSTTGFEPQELTKCG
jgi:TIR domain